ncbi:hypothetical protein B566_EDAN016782, partial [Ephemera danica]
MRPSSVLPNVGITLTRLANGGVYYFSPVGTAVSFTQARQFCADHGMHLVTIDSVNENALVFARASQLALWYFNAKTPPVAGQCASYIAPTAAIGAVTDPAISWASSICADPRLFICELDYPCN